MTYDTDANLAGDGVWTYGHDAQGRLVSAARAGTTIGYGYDAAGRRRSRTVNGVTTTSLWAGEQEVAEYDAAGALLRRFVWGPMGVDEIVAIIGVTGTAAARRRFQHADGLGSVVAATTPSGTLEAKFAYTPYGVADSNAGPPWRFTGRRLDPDTGLYYLRARDYSPLLGRFLQPDPIGIAGGINLYAYVGNDPLNGTDPLGLLSLEGTVRFVGGVAQAAVGVGVGVATSWTGIGAVAGGVIAAHGIDTAVAAWRGTETFTSQALQGAGLTQGAANAIELGISGSAGAADIAAGARLLPYTRAALGGGGGGTSLISRAARGDIEGIPPIATGKVIPTPTD
jgi:RHS repeat-associated protein